MGFPINPPNTALVMADGRCSREWWLFFLEIQKAIGGPSDPFEDATLLAYNARQAFDGSSDLSDALLAPPSHQCAPEDDLTPYPNGYLTRLTRDEADARYTHEGSGTSFPGSPATGDLFRRTDRNIQYFYDGTRWLSAHLYSAPLGASLPVTVATASYHSVPFLGTYGLYLEKLDYTSFRNAAGEWDITLDWVSLTNVNTTLATVDGNGTTSSNWIAGSVTINAVLDANAKALRLNLNEVSGTATFYGSIDLQYRLIG